jgi:hypothetical protein
MFTRVLSFPDKSVGDLLDERFPECPKIADARGDVAVLGRPKLVLRLTEPPGQYPFLTTLKADLLYGIRLAFGPVCQADLLCLLTLKGLRLIDLSGSGVGDDAFLGFVTSLPCLRVIDFGGTLVSDLAFRDMPRLQSALMLRSLGRRTQVGNRGALSVGVKMPRLVTLDFSQTDIGDEGVRGIAHLPLRFLNILGTRITDAGFASLASMLSLRKLVLSHTKISDAAMYFLQTMSRLTLLMLDGTAVTDEGLSYLLKLPRLSVLYLNSTQITDKATKWLARMTQLRVLSVGHQLGQDSLECLRKALPDCRISAIS